MSAKILRKAAALMRERAEAATPGPWESDLPGQTWRTWDGHVETVHPDFEEVDNTIARVLSNGDSQHIASWQPAAALAVADWLDDQALAFLTARPGNYSSTQHAMTVALTYLKADQ